MKLLLLFVAVVLAAPLLRLVTGPRTPIPFQESNPPSNNKLSDGRFGSATPGAVSCAQLGNDEWTQNFLGDRGREALAINPLAAVSFAHALLREHRRVRLLDAIAVAWMNRDPRTVGAWIGVQADASSRDPRT